MALSAPTFSRAGYAGRNRQHVVLPISTHTLLPRVGDIQHPETQASAGKGSRFSILKSEAMDPMLDP